MGGVTLMYAQERFIEALDERLEEVDDPNERESIYRQCVERLSELSADEVALDNFSKEIAVEGSSVVFPGKSRSDGEDL
jgi:hypothetical protein